MTLEEGSRGRAGSREQGGKSCSERQKGCWVSTPGHVLIQLNTGVHSVTLGTGDRHTCVVCMGVLFESGSTPLQVWHVDCDNMGEHVCVCV